MSNNSRTTLTNQITNKFKVLLDKHIDSVLDTFKKVLGDEEELKDLNTRKKKLRFIENNMQYVDETNLKKVQQFIDKCLIPVEPKGEKMKKVIKKASQPLVPKIEKMKKVMLEIINKLLVVMDRDKIEDLCDFKDIPREELIDAKCAKIFVDNRDYIFANNFSKHECQIYQKKS